MTDQSEFSYLFYGTDPSSPNELHQAIEEGFKTKEEYDRLGSPSFPGLVNSVSSADSARIAAFFSEEDGFAHIRSAAKNSDKTAFKMDELQTLKEGLVQIPPGQILVCKVLLSNCFPDSHCPNFDGSKSPSQVWKDFPVNSEYFPSAQSVYRYIESEPKNKIWFIFDNALILPEYFVEFDYVLKSSTERKQDQIKKEAFEIFKASNEAQNILMNTYLNP